MRLLDRTNPSLDLLQRLPSLPQVDLARSTQVLRLALVLLKALSRPVVVRRMP